MSDDSDWSLDDDQPQISNGADEVILEDDDALMKNGALQHSYPPWREEIA
jgi:hypothetical protein